MRAIDADALVHKIFCEWGADPKYLEGIDIDGIKAFTDGLILERLAEMPTIEAIPFEDYRSIEQTVYKLTQALAEAAPNHGRWIYYYDNGLKRCKCSECLTSYGCIDTPFCPNCGADMREVEEDEDDL